MVTSSNKFNKITIAIITLVLTLVIKHFGIEDINHYESSCLFMLIDRLADYDTRETLWGLLAGATIVVGVGIIVYQVFDIITCFTFPEDMIIGKLQVIYSRMKQ